MDKQEIKDLLNFSEFEFSGDDDEEEYMPLDFARTLQLSEEIEEEEARPDEVETEDRGSRKFNTFIQIDYLRA